MRRHDRRDRYHGRMHAGVDKYRRRSLHGRRCELLFPGVLPGWDLWLLLSSRTGTSRLYCSNAALDWAHASVPDSVLGSARHRHPGAWRSRDDSSCGSRSRAASTELATRRLQLWIGTRFGIHRTNRVGAVRQTLRHHHRGGVPADANTHGGTQRDAVAYRHGRRGRCRASLVGVGPRRERRASRRGNGRPSRRRDTWGLCSSAQAGKLAPFGHFPLSPRPVIGSRQRRVLG